LLHFHACYLTLYLYIFFACQVHRSKNRQTTNSKISK
jgi:hypothetical protein